jgi:hypothetical protein
MSYEFQILRGRKGGSLSVIDQTANTSYTDDFSEPDRWNYAVRPINTSTGETGALSDQKVVEIIPMPWQTSDDPSFTELLKEDTWKERGVEDYTGEGKTPTFFLTASRAWDIWDSP